ncbi:MAG: polysaccharide deacetylase family protein [bacterium]|nr:polysaccharide deacetylase family protein [bacterium]
MENYLKNIKILFSATILLLIMGIIIGISVLKDSNLFTAQHISQVIDYLHYKSSFTYTNDKNLTASVISIFANTSPSIKGNDVAKSIPVLLYHGIINEPDGSNILLKNFKEQMFALKKAGWQTVSIEDFYKFMKGEKELPDKSFLLTFDDGRKDSYYTTDPLLRSLSYTAVMFIDTEHSITLGGNKYYLSPQELRVMLKSKRWEIQSHGRMAHSLYPISSEGAMGTFLGNKLWLHDKESIETDEEFRLRIEADIAGSKDDIHQAFGVDVNGFAYPFGDFGHISKNYPEAENVVLDTVKSVYPMSFYQVWPRKGFSFNYPEGEQFLVKRIGVRPYWSSDNLLKVLDTAKEKNLPYIDNFSNYNGWLINDGKLSIENTSMILGSNSSTGSSVFLDGSYLWKNYIFKSNIRLLKGKSFSLLSRYKDSDNHVSCQFTPEYIRIEYAKEGNKTLVQEKKGKFVFIGRNREVGMGVNDNVVDCYIDGEVALKSDGVIKIPNHGGVGFETWDPEVNNSDIVIKEISVEEIK